MMSALQCQLEAQKVGSSILPARTHPFYRLVTLAEALSIRVCLASMNVMTRYCFGPRTALLFVAFLGFPPASFLQYCVPLDFLKLLCKIGDATARGPLATSPDD
jgi:hypothetical protein